jgi:hypothetical protein
MPPFVVPISRSGTGRLLVAALAVATLTACLCVSRLGYPGVGLGLIAVLLPCHWLLWRQRSAGACLCCRDGAWFWTPRAGEPRQVLIAPGPVLLPLLLQLRWRHVGERRWRQLWLFPDSADPGSLRRLRRQLRLQG